MIKLIQRQIYLYDVVLFLFNEVAETEFVLFAGRNGDVVKVDFVAAVFTGFHQQGLFAGKGLFVLDSFSDQTFGNLEIAFTAFETGNTDLARKVEPLEQVIDGLAIQMRANHILRLQAGTCTIELGFILSDLINGMERVSDHCSNIAVALIEVSEGVFDTHKYLNDIKSGNDDRFRAEYELYKEKYAIA